jgi:hypothetical protein
MTQAIGVNDITFKAEVDLSAKRYHAVVLGTGNYEVNLAGANARAIGFLQDKPPQGSAAAVRVMGTTIAIAGGAVAKDVKLKIDASGQVSATGGEAAGTVVNVVGRSLQAATTAGDQIEVLIEKYQYTA